MIDEAAPTPEALQGLSFPTRAINGCDGASHPAKPD
jgi:hypothetical protein